METPTNQPMKPGIGIFISIVVSLLVMGGGLLIWYLSATAELSRKAPAQAPRPIRLPNYPQPPAKP